MSIVSEFLILEKERITLQKKSYLVALDKMQSKNKERLSKGSRIGLPKKSLVHLACVALLSVLTRVLATCRASKGAKP